MRVTVIEVDDWLAEFDTYGVKISKRGRPAMDYYKYRTSTRQDICDEFSVRSPALLETFLSFWNGENFGTIDRIALTSILIEDGEGFKILEGPAYADSSYAHRALEMNSEDTPLGMAALARQLQCEAVFWAKLEDVVHDRLVTISHLDAERLIGAIASSALGAYHKKDCVKIFDFSFYENYPF